MIQREREQPYCVLKNYITQNETTILELVAHEAQKIFKKTCNFSQKKTFWSMRKKFACSICSH